MAFVFAVIGAVVGTLAGAADATFVGLLAGLFVGVLYGRFSTLQQRVAELQQQLAIERAAAAAATRRPTPAPAAEAGAPSAAPPRAAAPPPAAATPPPPPHRPEPEPTIPAAGAAPAPAASPAAALRAAFEAREPAPAPAPVMPRVSAPPTPYEPSPVERAAAAIKRWFTEGNVPVKLGMLVLFVGVAALLKYAIDQGLLEIPVEVWHAIAAGFGFAGLAFGWHRRESHRVFALSLQGGAIGILLITVFSAFRLYQLMPAGAAFALIVVLVAASAMLAILQHALALAVLGFIGGYLAPVLISTGNHVALFTYYAVLNAAVFVVAWVRPWRLLNLVGFGFTFVVGLGKQYYTPEHFRTVEPFLILFFLFYVLIAVAYALRQPLEKRGVVDGTLTFGAPLLAFPLQAAMVEEPMLLAYSALAVAGVYALLFRLLWRRAGLRVLAESFAGLAIGFATLAVPLALSAQWTATTWALEGAALIWLGLRQERLLPRLTGGLLQLAAGLAYVASVIKHGWLVPEDALVVLNGRCLSALLIALGAFAAARLYDAYHRQSVLSGLLFAWATLWWTTAGVHEIDRFVPRDQVANVAAAFVAGSMLLAALLRRALAWPKLGWLAVLGFVVMLPLAMVGHAANDGVFERDGWTVWVPYLIAMRGVLWLLREPEQRGLSIAHVATLATPALLLGMQLNDVAIHHATLGWGWADALSILPLLVIAIAIRHAPGLTLPLADRFVDYRWLWFVPAAAVLAFWWLLSLARSGDPAPLPFVPLLNPLELTELGILLFIGALLGDAFGGLDDPRARGLYGVLALAAFLLVTAATLRAVHHIAQLPWDPALFDSMVVQTSLTVVWSVIGVGAWIVGSKRGSRASWLAGAVLMGVVLAKLILIDRQYTGNVSGIVSFIAVGLLLTVVGYFAPSPPRGAIQEQAA
jgi:uncharacterized membrane protein